MSEKAQLGRIAQRGMADFETFEDVTQLQKDMLQCLQHSQWTPTAMQAWPTVGQITVDG